MPALAIADDATGALETGAQFARRGAATQVWFGEGWPERDRAAALVIDTETRHLPPREAYRRVRELPAGGFQRVYKKTDSTLRGNISAEFRALLEMFPGRPLVYAPAYPALGRTVERGELLVDGRPLAESAFAKDPLNPVREGSIPALLGDCGAPVVCVAGPEELAAALERAAVIVCDGSTDADLVAVAAVLDASERLCLAAGPAAFAGHWIGSPAPPRPVPPPAVRHCLIVNGSLHPASRRQVEAAGESDWPILTTPHELLGDPLSVARRLALSVRDTLEEGGFDGVIVFGGDTLRAILSALDIRMVTAFGELLPGVPLSRARWREGRLALITKAGGFGSPDELRLIRRALERQA
ncbi:MAG: hypothetical protein HY822_06375 [Acidobacteria bacterium]|nr:hypothetical protein [Acidobacteriota bacterium]